MSLVALPAAIVAGINERFPKLKSCEAHPGRFDLDELERFVAAAPAVRVAVLSVGGIVGGEDGVAIGDARITAFIVTRDAGRVTKDEAARAIVDGLAPLVFENRWGLATAQPARDVAATNLYSTPSGKVGVTLWAVTWLQGVEMGTLVAENGTMPEHVYASMAPDVGLAHKSDYRDVDTGEMPPDA